MRELDLDYRYLKAFFITGKNLSFSKAAHELNIAQSAVSRQVKLLEESLGEQLIIRSSKKVILTNKGTILLNKLERLENELIPHFLGEENRQIKVGILHGLLETWFIGIIRNYIKNNHHQISVEVSQEEQLSPKLIQGDYDLIFSTHNIQSELITSLKLFEEELVMISSSSIQEEEITKFPWVIYDEDDFLMHQYKKRSKQIIKVNSMTAIIHLVEQGCGIAIVPRHLIKKSSKLKISTLPSSNKASIYLSTLNYQQLPTHLDNLIHLIKDSIS